MEVGSQAQQQPVEPGPRVQQPKLQDLEPWETGQDPQRVEQEPLGAQPEQAGLESYKVVQGLSDPG